MGLRRIAASPLYRLVDWIDDNPVSAAGAVIALGGLGALAVSVTFGTGGGADAGGSTLGSGTAGLLAQAALTRPTYTAAAILGTAVLLRYDG